MPSPKQSIKKNPMTTEPVAQRMFRTLASGIKPIRTGTDVGIYFDDPAGFVRNCFEWPRDEGPASYQIDIMRMLEHHHRVAVRSPHGAGKTALEAWLLLWFACTREARGIDWKVPTTAGGWHQLTHYLWPEVNRWANLLRPEIRQDLRIVPGRSLLQLQLRLRLGEAFAIASNKPMLLEGAHATQLLYLFDESKAIAPATWDAAEGAFSTGTHGRHAAYAVACSTPGDTTGRFYDIHQRRAGYEDWERRHITKEEAIKAGRIARTWADLRRRQWGETSPIYLNRVEGEFASSAEDTIIPLSWVEAAMLRHDEWKARGEDPGPLDQVGADVGRGGNRSVLAPRCGHIITRLLGSTAPDTMQLASDIADMLWSNPGSIAMVDIMGVGAGVLDRLRQLKLGDRAHGFIGGAKSPYADQTGEFGFTNRRAEAYWRMRELLDPNSPLPPVLLPNSELLTVDLSAPRWMDRGGRIQVEEKEELSARIGHSPDDGDAVVMSFAGPVVVAKRPFQAAVAGQRLASHYEVR